MYKYSSVCLSVWQHVRTARFAERVLSLLLWSFVSPVWKPEHLSTWIRNEQKNLASIPTEASRPAMCPLDLRMTNVTLNPSIRGMGRGRKSSYVADIEGLRLSKYPCCLFRGTFIATLRPSPSTSPMVYGWPAGVSVGTPDCNLIQSTNMVEMKMADGRNLAWA
jgi:hypothetical protein